MTRIVSSKCPKEVISTTSWRDGRATVKKILGAKKVKPSSAHVGGSKKADTTYNVTSPTQDDVSEGSCHLTKMRILKLSYLRQKNWRPTGLSLS